ncbi:protein FAM13A isoform X5 [Ixodes scapularis]|uniref:protein FAM13A isoform X5 n=2 Tax=Ixodes scapularis TaxID=6945 RepID=UPI001A9EEDAE|nr:protein FAM13A isoform X5 [Ixodes scapularis]
MRKPTFCTDIAVAEMTSASQNLEVCGESRMERVRKLLSSPLARRKSGSLALRTFGVPLDSLVQQAAVPFVVVRLCQYLEKRGMAQEGLFRVSGNARLVEKLKWSFDHTGDAPLETEGDVAAVAALLKLLFRELPEPLMPSGMHPAFLDAIQEGEWVSLCSIASVHDREECTRRLKCLVEQLPPGNFGVLKYLCHFLNRVAQSEKLTRMTPSALGIVFGPNLFRFAEDLQGLKEQAVTNQVVTCFIADYHSIFEGDAELSCTADSSMNVEGSSSSSKANGRVIAGICAVPMQPLSVVIPPLDEAMLALKQEPLSEVPTLMIDSLIDGTCKQAIFYRHREVKEGSSAGVTSGRSCKRKERKLSGEEWPPAPRSSSEERPPAGGSLMEPQLASRRCSSHEEVAILDSAQGHTPKSTGSPCGGAASSEEANRDLSPHPPQPKRRELETPSTSSQESASQDWHEACRSAERLTPHHFKDVQYQPGSRKSGTGKSVDRPLSSGFQSLGGKSPSPRAEKGRASEEGEEVSVPHTPSTPGTFSKDAIPPLDLDSFRQEEPVLSEHRFSWPMVQALTEEEVVTPYLQKANSYEAPLSPSAYRSYLSHRSLHLDPSLPPSPPVEQDDFLKSNFKEEEANLTTIKQLSKKIHSLKKKVKQFEENFEKEHGYRPSHAEKMNHSEVKKLLLELNKLRKDVKNLREENSLPEPAYLSFSSWSRDQSKLGREPDENNGRPTRVMEKALNDTLTSLAEKRRMAQRPDSVDDMTREQVLEEKLAIQKALLRFESLHGRPSRRADRNLMRPLYDRYRNVKRLVGRAPPLAKGKDSELQPILEHVAMNFTSPQPRSPPQELEEGLELMPSMSAIKENLQEAPEDDCVADKAELVEQASGVLEKYNDSNLHELPLDELLQQQQQTKLEKRRLRRLLREFEEDFQKQTGRKVQKEDKAPMDSVYCEYKHVKARMRLLEALVSKHEHRRDI